MSTIYQYTCICMRCDQPFKSSNAHTQYCPTCKDARKVKKKRRKKSKGLTLAQINEKARAEGLTYAQYVAKYNL